MWPDPGVLAPPNFIRYAAGSTNLNLASPGSHSREPNPLTKARGSQATPSGPLQRKLALESLLSPFSPETPKEKESNPLVFPHSVCVRESSHLVFPLPSVIG